MNEQKNRIPGNQAKRILKRGRITNQRKVYHHTNSTSFIDAKPRTQEYKRIMLGYDKENKKFLEKKYKIVGNCDGREINELDLERVNNGGEL